MKWTNELPTEDGYYWLRYPQCQPEIALVSMDDRDSLLVRIFYEDAVHIDRRTDPKTKLWMGPIPEPEVG